MRVTELRAQVQAHDYRVDPRLVAEALLRRTMCVDPTVSRRADARSPAAAPPQRRAH
jgi:hypothetical protein